MANPFSKGWKYVLASLDHKIDENADPKIQIQQAIDAAKTQHRNIAEQAASVIGNKRQLEMKLNNLLKDQAGLQDKARSAVLAADQASSAGEVERAAQLNNTAEVLATQLVSVEQQIEETKALHNQAETAAAQASQQVKESEARLQEQMSQIDQLRAQVDQAAMQESSARAMDSIGAIKQDDSVPTLDAVRAKIEQRYTNALGAQEVIEQQIGGRMAEIQEAGNDMRASARLAEIRAELDKSKEGEPKQLEKSESKVAEQSAATDVAEPSKQSNTTDAELAEDVDEAEKTVNGDDAAAAHKDTKKSTKADSES